MLTTDQLQAATASSQQGGAGTAAALDFSSIFPAVLCGVVALLVVALLIQIGRGRLARELAQREADERVAAARAQRMLREGEERERAAAAAGAAAAGDVELASQPLPALVVSPGGGVCVAKAQKQFDECFCTDDDENDDENDADLEAEKENNARRAAPPSDRCCCDKGKSETDGSDETSR